MTDYLKDNLGRRMRYTPMRDVLRGKMTGRLDVRSALEELPEELQFLVGRVAVKTRLSRIERAEVIRDLAEHLHDGLEAGASTEELIRDFGEEIAVAKLIRSSMLRKRPAWARMRRQGIQGSLVVLLVALTFWIGWAYALSRERPNVRVDYVERLNDSMPAATSEQLAWPELRETHLAIRKLLDTNPQGTDANVLAQRLSRVVESMGGGIPPWSASTKAFQAPFAGQSDGEKFPDEDLASFRKNVEPHLNRLRELAGREAFGFAFSSTLSDEDAAFFGMEMQSPNAVGQNGSVLEVKLPHFGTLRNGAQLLVADAEEAFLAGDTDRFIADIQGALGFAAFALEGRLTIGYLVSFAIQNLTFSKIQDVLAVEPDAFTDEQLQSLAGILNGVSEEDFRIDLAAERFMFDDFVQRVYSDDGEGDGVLLLNLPIMDEYNTMQFTKNSSGVSDAVTFFFAPAATFTYLSRKEALHMYHTYMDRLQERFDADVLSPIGVDTVVDGVDVLHEPERAFPVSLLAPALDLAGSAAAQTRLRRDATLLAVALERKRRANGAWPVSLEELVPEYMAQVPRCPFDGGPLRYELREGKPLIWSVGQDLSDDGAIDKIGRLKTLDSPRTPVNPRSSEDLLLWLGPSK